MEIIQYLLIGTNVIVVVIILYYEAYVKARAEANVKLDTAAAITKIEESVKHIFQIELAKMQLEHQHRHSIALEQRNAIMNYSDCLHLLVRLSRLGIADKKYSEDLWAYTYDIEKRRSKYKLSLERLRLFFDEDKFRSVEAQTLLLTDKLQANTLNYIENAVSMNEQIKQAEDLKAINIDHLKAKQSTLFQSYRVPHDKLYEEYEKLRPQMRAILTSYIERVYNN
jgi:hypothetical protein